MSNNVIVSNNYVSTNPDYTVESEQQTNNSQRQVVATFDKYQISDVDESADPKYYGFLEVSGKWYIMRNTSDQSFRYVTGDSGYVLNWTNRASLAYDYFDVAF